LLEELGITGQDRIRAATVLLIGMGGLGCLAAAGVGRLLLADGDTVEISNLQRQIPHTATRIGENKAQSASTTLHTVNPKIETTVIPRRLGEAGILAAVAEADIVVDGSDNFPTRYAVNRAAVTHQKPLISGAISRFSGQLAVFDLRHAHAPCYNCLFRTGKQQKKRAAP
jgi:adenylyltransferase/sulfurtransferase